jgi:hypothetical protein
MPNASPAVAPFKTRGRVPMFGVMLRIAIIAGALVTLLSLSGYAASAEKHPSSADTKQEGPRMRQAVRQAGRQLDEISSKLQRTGADVGVDTSGCHPRSSLVGCYAPSPVAFRRMIAAFARVQLAATIPDVGTQARCQWAGARMDCLVTARSHTRTRSSVVQLSLGRDLVVTQAIAPG